MFLTVKIWRAATSEPGPFTFLSLAIMSWMTELVEVGRTVVKASRRIEKGRPNLLRCVCCNGAIAYLVLESCHITPGTVSTLCAPRTKSGGSIVHSRKGRPEKVIDMVCIGERGACPRPFPSATTSPSFCEGDLVRARGLYRTHTPEAAICRWDRLRPRMSQGSSSLKVCLVSPRLVPLLQTATPCLEPGGSICICPASALHLGHLCDPDIESATSNSFTWS